MGNEKLFFILWIFLLPLALFTLIDQCISISFYFSKEIRNAFLCKFVLPQYPEKRARLRKVVDTLKFGDWLVLYLIARNIDRALFTCLADKIYKPGSGYYPEEDEDNISLNGLKHS